MKHHCTLIGLLIVIGCFAAASGSRAQIVEIGYSPVSNKGLGALPNTSKFDVSLLFKAYQAPWGSYVPGIRYTHVHSKNKMLHDTQGTKVNGSFNMLFLVPLSFNFPVWKLDIVTRFGFGFSGKHFPNKNGFIKNFLLEAGIEYPLTSFFALSLRYSHISNGGMATFNPGVDNVKLGVAFNF